MYCAIILKGTEKPVPPRIFYVLTLPGYRGGARSCGHNSCHTHTLQSLFTNQTSILLCSAASEWDHTPFFNRSSSNLSSFLPARWPCPVYLFLLPSNPSSLLSFYSFQAIASVSSYFTYSNTTDNISKQHCFPKCVMVCSKWLEQTIWAPLFIVWLYRVVFREPRRAFLQLLSSRKC